MKFLNTIIFATAVFLLGFGCNKTDEQQPREILVSVKCGGEILDVSVSDLTKSSDSDIYGIQVYSWPENGNYGENKPYAYGLFSSLENLTIKLLEGYKYRFVATVVIDGKDRISHDAGGYSYPFYFTPGGSSNLLSSFVYSSDKYLSGLRDGLSICTYGGTVSSFSHPNVDRYYGELREYTPVENGTISIDLKRTAFGIKVVATDLTEGSLSVKIYDAPEILVTYPDTENEEILTFKDVYSAWDKDEYKESIQVSFSWIKADGVVVPIKTDSFDFYRNKKTNITIKIGTNSSIDNGITVNKEDTPIGEGGSYNI